jgi:hypothetical protein
MFFPVEEIQVLSFDILDPMSRLDRMSPLWGAEKYKSKGTIQCMEALRVTVLQYAIPSYFTSQQPSLNFSPRRIAM